MSKMNLKKSIALTVALTTLLSLAAFFTLPVAAMDGNFDTHGSAVEEDGNYDGDKNSVAGYQYTHEGLHITTADWSTGAPYSHVSTKDTVDLKDGVYMQVRIDDFNYAAADKWFNFNLWSEPAIDVGSGDPSYGYGVQTIIRPSSSGSISSVAWYKQQFTACGSSAIYDEHRYPIDGKLILTIIVTWDGLTYNVEINGAAAPEKVIDYMNETYAENSFAYVGFTMYSNEKGGSQEATILKFGSNEYTAFTPMGDDEKYPENYHIEYAELGSADDIDEGEPAVLMSGDKEYSDLKGTPTSATGSKISISDDLLVHVVGSKQLTDCGVWKVDNDVSYDISDFPVVLIMTKNFCSCAGDNGECWAFEEAYAYIACGDSLVPNPNNKYYAEVCYDSYFIGNDSYLYFIADLSDETGEDGRFNGRINSTRVDFNIELYTPGANEFDVVMQGFFRTKDEAAEYAMNYLADHGYDQHYYDQGYNEGWDAGYADGSENGFNDGFGGNYGDNLYAMDTPVDPDAYTRGYIDGYNSAFSSAYDTAYQRAQEAYSYYQQGYSDGYNEGIKIDGDYSEGYNKGYEDGYNIGHNDGYNEGHTEGCDEGYDNGYDEGYDNGYNEGYNRGFNDGEEVTREDLGYDQGFTEGYDKGYIDGYDKGAAENKEETSREPEGGDYQEGYDSGYSDGYKDGKKDGKKENNGNSSSSSNNNGNNSTEYDRGYNDGYADGATDATAKISELLGGCEANLGSGALLLIATAIPSLYIFFKRKKND